MHRLTRRATTLPLALLLAACASASCARCRECREDELEEQEERDLARDHFWRARLVIHGHGRVRTHVAAFDCTSDGVAQRGECGPKLVRYKELAPPAMEAVPEGGWRFDHWESSTLEPDGSTHGRSGPMPDGRIYVNGFGYSDTGELETVTAVFVPLRDGS